MKTYCIFFTLNRFGAVYMIDVVAKSKEEAYFKAVYEAIPQGKSELPYSAWVHSVTYSNGNYHKFDTFEGKPY